MRLFHFLVLRLDWLFPPHFLALFLSAAIGAGPSFVSLLVLLDGAAGLGRGSSRTARSSPSSSPRPSGGALVPAFYFIGLNSFLRAIPNKDLVPLLLLLLALLVDALGKAFNAFSLTLSLLALDLVMILYLISVLRNRIDRIAPWGHRLAINQLTRRPRRARHRARRPHPRYDPRPLRRPAGAHRLHRPEEPARGAPLDRRDRRATPGSGRCSTCSRRRCRGLPALHGGR